MSTKLNPSTTYYGSRPPMSFMLDDLVQAVELRKPRTKGESSEEMTVTILEMIPFDTWIRSSQVFKETFESRKASLKRFRDMEKRRLIERKGVGPTTFWRRLK